MFFTGFSLSLIYLVLFHVLWAPTTDAHRYFLSAHLELPSSFPNFDILEVVKWKAFQCFAGEKSAYVPIHLTILSDKKIKLTPRGFFSDPELKY